MRANLISPNSQLKIWAGCNDSVDVKLSEILETAAIFPDRLRVLDIRSLIEKVIAAGTTGRAEKSVTALDLEYGSLSGINVIPSRGRGICGDVLMAFCFDRDNFERVIVDILLHCSDCPGTKQIFLLSTKYDEKPLRRYEARLKHLNANFSLALIKMGQIRFVD